MTTVALPLFLRRFAASPTALAAVLATGCATVPTPLHPGAHGSVGYPHNGVLTDARELPAKGAGYAWHRAWGRHFGTPAMVAFLEDATQKAAPTGEGFPFLVGDIAQKAGGKASGHHSHRTGRDVDILFAYLTPGGAPAEAPGFVKVHADGLAYVPGARGSTFVRFDVARNWALVKAMVQSPHAPVQWIFVYRPIESLLIEYARAKGEPNELVWRAETVMHEPGDSLPHDDHFHVRIACTDDDLGCLGGGPRWPWLAPPKQLGTDELVALLRDGDHDDAQAATTTAAPAPDARR
jgi:penicillin-insensitive murein endopeptidase